MLGRELCKSDVLQRAGVLRDSSWWPGEMVRASYDIRRERRRSGPGTAYPGFPDQNTVSGMCIMKEST